MNNENPSHPSFLTPNVYQVIPTDDYKVYVYMNDGSVRLFDAKPLTEKGDRLLADINFFKERCAVINGTLAWDVAGNRDPYKCFDVCPDILYECPMVKDILEDK
ncbi:MAG: DUF2442 domain-containing protein [Oscillospiraceae bacterium]|jgi:hypothetical protein|nr:DUF2442 domain-containing protein [Oscillospiraceae bacterium]